MYDWIETCVGVCGVLILRIDIVCIVLLLRIDIVCMLLLQLGTDTCQIVEAYTHPLLLLRDLN